MRPVLILVVLALTSEAKAEPPSDAPPARLPQVRSVPLHGSMTLGELPVADSPPSSDDGLTRLKINPPAEYDSLPRSAIYSIRQERVAEHADLLARLAVRDYWPLDAVFGGIEDGRPWWGLLGLHHYGRGSRSMEGPSEESRYIENPYLLVGLRESWAFTKRGEPKGLYVRPTRLSWHGRSPVAWARYNLFSYLTEMNRDHQSDYTYYWDLWLVAYNARDLGLSFISIDVKRSSGIHFSDQANQVIEIPYFLHAGMSCGVPGGCNNVSPTFTPLNIRLLGFPARAYIKLWRERPRSADEPPNVWFVIDMPREADPGLSP